MVTHRQNSPSVPTGLCRSIGVSNFMIHHLEQLKEDCTVVPHINQVSISQRESRTDTFLTQ